VTATNRLDDFALNPAEIIVAPVVMEYLLIIVNCQLSIINYSSDG